MAPGYGYMAIVGAVPVVCSASGALHVVQPWPTRQLTSAKLDNQLRKNDTESIWVQLWVEQN